MKQDCTEVKKENSITDKVILHNVCFFLIFNQGIHLRYWLLIAELSIHMNFHNFPNSCIIHNVYYSKKKNP